VNGGRVEILVGCTEDKSTELSVLSSGCKRVCFRHTAVGTVSLEIAVGFHSLRPKHLCETGNTNSKDDGQKYQQKFNYKLHCKIGRENTRFKSDIQEKIRRAAGEAFI
jgi:hypothetical protein